jgi:DNA transposition AAA+ family ATPase
MNTVQKQQIQGAILALKNIGKSQNAIATEAGVSSANISQILAGNWERISDELWRKVSANLRVQVSGWQTAEITNYKRVQGVCSFAKAQSTAKIIAFDAGFGKTYALTAFAAATAGVYYMQCERHYTKKVFLQKFGRVLGLNLQGSVAEMIDMIIDKLKSVEKPLIIWDEYDKVLEKKGVFDLFKTFYDATLDYCGFVLCGTTALEQELRKCVQKNKIGYVELLSRCGREYVHLSALTKKDIAEVCKVNGIADVKTIEEICIQLGQGDLRQLKSLIEQKNTLAAMATT